MRRDRETSLISPSKGGKRSRIARQYLRVGSSPSRRQVSLPGCVLRQELLENMGRRPTEIRGRMFFTFPENARWDAGRQVVEFGVEIGEYQGMVRVPRRVFQRLLPESPTPERCLEAYYLQRTRFETIAERKLRQRQLTDDGNVEITGRDIRGSAVQPQSPKLPVWR
jgi:Protein of unknown function (DUF1488)